MLKRIIHTARIMGKTKKKTTTEPIEIAPLDATEKAISVNKNGQIILRIHAKPGAKLSTVTGVGESEVDVAIAAPPRDGQANEELLNFVGKLLDLRKSELDFDKGAKSRSKVLLITSNRMTVDQIAEKLRDAAIRS